MKFPVTICFKFWSEVLKIITTKNLQIRKTISWIFDKNLNFSVFCHPFFHYFHLFYLFIIAHLLAEISYPLKKRIPKIQFCASMYQLAILFAVYIAIHAVRKCTKNKQTKHIIITYILPIFVIIFAEILLLLLGAIHILRQHNFRLFLWPTHYVSINTVLNVSKAGHYVDPPTQLT